MFVPYFWLGPLPYLPSKLRVLGDTSNPFRLDFRCRSLRTMKNWMDVEPRGMGLFPLIGYEVVRDNLSKGWYVGMEPQKFLHHCFNVPHVHVQCFCAPFESIYPVGELRTFSLHVWTDPPIPSLPGVARCIVDGNLPPLDQDPWGGGFGWGGDRRHPPLDFGLINTDVFSCVSCSDSDPPLDRSVPNGSSDPCPGMGPFEERVEHYVSHPSTTVAAVVPRSEVALYAASRVKAQSFPGEREEAVHLGRPRALLWSRGVKRSEERKEKKKKKPNPGTRRLPPIGGKNETEP